MPPLPFDPRLADLFLFFVLYSFLGWCMETAFCCARERRWVSRGFLFGPLCPIYGIGALIMVGVGELFQGSPVVFYLAAAVLMSAWEYLVGWFLEATTKMKYWDYSHHRFHLNGRVSLVISLWWGVLAFAVVYYIHPPIAGLVLALDASLRQLAALVCLVLLVADATLTIHHLALIRRLLTRLERLSLDMQQQWEERPEARLMLEDAKYILKERYELTLEMLERATRRFRKAYRRYGSKRFDSYLAELRERGNELRDKARELGDRLKAGKK